MAKENTDTAPEKGTLPKGTFMSGAQAKKNEAPVPGRDRFLSSQKTGNRQSGNCHTAYREIDICNDIKTWRNKYGISRTKIR
jgi:hypothetical protein